MKSLLKTAIILAAVLIIPVHQSIQQVRRWKYLFYGFQVVRD
jgi:hypothetical protein